MQQRLGEPYQGEPRPGDVFNQQTDLRQLLLAAGWQPHHTDADGTEYLTRPGKQSTDGYSASLGHVIIGARPQAQQQYHAAVAKQLPEPEAYQPFPLQLFPDVVQPYVSEHAAAIGIDPAYVAVPMLSVRAGLIGQSRGLQLKRTWKLPSIIWAVTIGDVSSGKIPGWEAATAPAAAIESALHRMMQQRDADYQEHLAAYDAAKAEGKAPDSKPTKEPSNEQLTLNDTTMEKLIEIHSHNHKLILSCDELAAWLRSMDQYRGGKGRDVENWLSIYNGGGIQVNRKLDNYRVYLQQNSISVCGTIQPGVTAETLFTERFIENGFAARILSVQPPSSIVRWSDREVPEAIDEAMHSLAVRLYGLPREQHGTGHRTLMLPCTDAAKHSFIHWTDTAADHAETLDPALRDSWLKLRPVAGRFALVFAIVKQLLQHPEGQAMLPIDAESMQAGIDLAWWFGNELQRNYAGDEQAGLREHLHWMLQYHPTGLDARTLQQGRRSIKTADDARIVMQKLTELDSRLHVYSQTDILRHKPRLSAFVLNPVDV